MTTLYTFKQPATHLLLVKTPNNGYAANTGTPTKAKKCNVMKRQLSLCLVILLCVNLYAQQFYFNKQWDKSYGGLNGEFLRVKEYTKDGGLIIGGDSNSDIGGNKTENNWDASFVTYDYYIIKTDINGNKEWDKRFGGLSDDGLFALDTTNDGGYILGGFTNSGMGGDKTEPSRGGYDYWVVKIDSAGNKQWDKRFGGIKNDLLFEVKQAIDGGYILGGFSYSGISGDKTQPNWDTTNVTPDYWVVKIDSAGNKQWDNRYGGNSGDLLRSLDLTYDGGYILGGYSGSDTTGDKTQSNWDTTNNGGTGDYWVVKIDSVGNKQWDKRYGTVSSDKLFSVMQTLDGNYLLGGGADSGITGNKTVAKGGIWLIKINNIGNIIWQKVYDGGAGFKGMNRTNDGGYLISGEGYKNFMLPITSPDRTDDCLGSQNTWILKLDSAGNKQWDKTIFTIGNDYGGYAVQTNDGCYLVANSSRAGIGGYKTQAAWDSSFDFFIVKFSMDTVTGIEEPRTKNQEPRVQVYPNPFSSEVSILLQAENLKEATFVITSTIGEVIYQRKEENLADNYTKVLDLSPLPNGIYFIQIATNGTSVVRKIVKE